MKIYAPKDHPRYVSNLYRDVLSQGVKRGITSLQGLTAHGRAEAFDYLLGEKTESFAFYAIRAAAATLLLAQHPVISVNGNTAVLVPQQLITLTNLTKAQLEINLFHKSAVRERKIRSSLLSLGAKEVLLPNASTLPHIQSNRRLVNSKGQIQADVVFVPLEDGDRTESLISLGKNIITVDLNPLSRTAKKATITIVDHIVRAIPLLIEETKHLQKLPKEKLQNIVYTYKNSNILAASLLHIKKRLETLATVPISW